MIHLTVPGALAVIVLWPLGIWFCTSRYLKARKAGQKTDTIIWFVAWCMIIAMVEWFMLAIYVLIEKFFYGATL